MTTRVEHAVTSGTFSLDGGTWDVDNNVWVVGDDTECVVIDAPHDAGPIAGLIGDRRLLAVLCTHAHDDHVTVARELAERYDAPVRLHPNDDVLWRMTYPDVEYQPLADGDTVAVGDVELQVLHTPGHAPGAVCYYAPDLGAVFTGDTLFQGGPGATGRSYSDYDTITATIRDRLFTLPDETVVHTGHGDDTSIADERAGASSWQRPD
ncbi:MBL fold metallo-hydrolase [uncultured Jatrophihabitans sp.]|uniref:MBL fold metallo-hydrolase n=1 Tax=uncultured Jatrophihabitans sp. TaxID=1610747 RepID=UPI0035CCA8AD